MTLNCLERLRLQVENIGCTYICNLRLIAKTRKKMKLITRDIDYAMRALACMARSSNEIVTVKDLVAVLRIPRPFLRKILQTLNAHRILKSYKGKKGGFSIAVPIKDVSLFDIIKIFQGDLRLNDHAFKGKMCPNFNMCALKKELDIVEDKLEKELKSITLDVMLRKCDR